MHRTFVVPRRLHPAYSLLGRWLRRRLGDPRRAEALYLVVLTGLVLTLLLVQFLAWAILVPTLTAVPTGRAAVALWTLPAGSVVLLLLTAVVGLRPAVTVTLDVAGLRLHQGSRTLYLPFDAIRGVTPLDPLLYHRHYARYRATRAFVNRLVPELLLLHTLQGPVVIGLLPGDHAALHRALTTRLSPAVAA